MAMQHHPDRGGDNDRFQEIQQAYDVLGDAEKRAQYDNPQPQGVNINFGGGFQDIFDIFRNGGFGGFGPQQHQRRGHARIELWVSLEDVAQGGRRTVSIGTPAGTTAVEIDIPQAVPEGTHVQYPGLAPGGQDLVVTYRVRPHPVWQRNGMDLHTQREIMVWDLITGGEFAVTDIYGSTLTARIPAMCQPGTRLRLRGRGLRDSNGNVGDVFVQVQCRLPENIDSELLAAIQKHR